jgi:hypothetical protein
MNEPPTVSVARTWWAPEELGWWTGCLFAVGSTCFALGSAPGYVAAVGDAADAVTYFVGSIFFTTAASLALVQVWGRRPGPDWWACAVQLVGTLLFNVSTFDAMLRNLSAQQTNRLVWTPDVLGSICFLVASGIAWRTVAHRWWSWQPRSSAWWIGGLNLIGSIAFGASALAAHVVPGTDQVRNVTLMNLGTFVGALAFLVGGLLLLPTPRTPDRTPSSPQTIHP